MKRILDITQKDLVQIFRNRMTFLFLLIMPIAFTFLFGMAFGGTYSAPADSRLPVAYLDQDNTVVSQGLQTLLENSTVIRLDVDAARTPEDMQTLVTKGKMAAALIIPAGYGQSVQDGEPMKLTFIQNPANTSSGSVQNEIGAASNRLTGSAKTANIIASAGVSSAGFEEFFKTALAAWQKPPVRVDVSASGAIKQVDGKSASMAQSSPGMMLQFAIATLLTAATVIVNERKSRSLQRLLTTATSRVEILLGHYLAIFALIFGQIVLLILFGHFILKVEYLRLPLASLLVAIATAACISALGLLIGVFGKSEEQAIIFSLIPMFILSGLGGAWVPLEITGATFRAVGHVSPVAWAMDGFKNIVIRGLTFQSVLLPVGALLGYAILFFGLAAWRFRRVSE
jgi:ABC-2 type transport system permease protein